MSDTPKDAPKDSLTDNVKRQATRLGLLPSDGFPVPPRKAMGQAKKISKGRLYPLPPYISANPLLLFRWAEGEWKRLGKHQGVALPFIVLTVLLTWNKERQKKEDVAFRIGILETRRYARQLQDRLDDPKIRKKKLFGFIPLP